MDYDKVKSALSDKSITLLDVRGVDERKKEGRIPGSQNVPVSEVKEAMGLSDADFSAKYGFPKPGQDDPIVTHCMKGARAAKAAEALKEAGFSKVQIYEGSFNDWKEKGGAVETD